MAAGLDVKQAQSLFDGGAGETDEVSQSAIEREHAAGENAAGHGTSIFDLDRESTELYSPSGMPAALMASVTRMARSGPLARHQRSTISGAVWMPSQISSA